jgi:hypothetical protein
VTGKVGGGDRLPHLLNGFFRCLIWLIRRGKSARFVWSGNRSKAGPEGFESADHGLGGVSGF